jgi:predicted amidohydrolase
MTKMAWRATCIQMRSSIASLADGRKAARKIIDDNLDRAVTLIASACNSERSPDVVVIPEFALQGPPHGETPDEWIDKACEPIPGTITQRLQELARRKGIFIAGNQFDTDARWPGRVFNTCFLIDRAGDVILKFRRINTAMWTSPHDFMDAYLAEVGLEGAFPVAETELGRIAVIACGEIAVPEVARVFMMRGAEILLHPTNDEGNAGLEAAKVARAAENMCFVVSANVAAVSASPKTEASRAAGRASSTTSGARLPLKAAQMKRSKFPPTLTFTAFARHAATPAWRTPWRARVGTCTGRSTHQPWVIPQTSFWPCR